jgi:2-dehydropantoate 2-reductase
MAAYRKLPPALALRASYPPVSIISPHPAKFPQQRNISGTKADTRIHVLGLGSIGTFTAHSLAEAFGGSFLTLLLHRPSLCREYLRNGRQSILETRHGQTGAQTGYGFEALHNSQWHCLDLQLGEPEGILSCIHGSEAPTERVIDELIVCVKSTQTVAALRPLASRLSRKSNILFLQNGAGMIDDANTHLWPDPKHRPNYLTGVISHGVALNRSFNITHTGPAATAIGSVPREDGDTWHPPSPMLGLLPLAPRLNCHAYSWPSILQIQLEKLACNALSNPLCALADATTAHLFSMPETCTALMQEISAVVLALPELQGVEGVQERFAAKALEKTVMDIVEKNRATTTSMVWDMRNRRETEIRYINGYWARRGRDVGVRTPLNDELVDRIEAMTRARREGSCFPNAEDSAVYSTEQSVGMSQ